MERIVTRRWKNVQVEEERTTITTTATTATTATTITKTNKSTAPVPLSPELRFPLVKCSGTALELLFIPQSAALTRAGCIQDRFSIVSSLLLPSLFIHCCCWPPGAALQLLPNCPSVALPAPELHRNCTGTAPELHRNCTGTASSLPSLIEFVSSSSSSSSLS